MLQRATQRLHATLWSQCELASVRMAGSLPKPLTDQGTPTITEGRQAFDGDLRATSGLGLGDGIMDHTGKWLQVCSIPSVFESCSLRVDLRASRLQTDRAPLPSSAFCVSCVDNPAP